MKIAKIDFFVNLPQYSLKFVPLNNKLIDIYNSEKNTTQDSLNVQSKHLETSNIYNTVLSNWDVTATGLHG